MIRGRRLAFSYQLSTISKPSIVNHTIDRPIALRECFIKRFLDGQIRRIPGAIRESDGQIRKFPGAIRRFDGQISQLDRQISQPGGFTVLARVTILKHSLKAIISP